MTAANGAAPLASKPAMAARYSTRVMFGRNSVQSMNLNWHKAEAGR